MDVVSPEIEERYSTALASWQYARGAVRYDLTPEEFARLRAVEGALGDVKNAPRLLFARFLYRNGKIRL